MRHDMQPFKVSDICGQLIRDLQSESTESLTVQDILQTLEDRAYALIILLLALPKRGTSAVHTWNFAHYRAAGPYFLM